MECQLPTINSTTPHIREILHTIKTIAVMGLSPDEDKPSHRVAKYMQEQGYTIVPVYPKEETILGQKVYRTLAEIPFAIDCVNIFRKPDACLPITQEALKRGDAKVIWMQEGIVNNDAAQLAVDAGVKVVQSKCIMIEHKAMLSK
ncbi:MAG: CoA-binding protein [Sulfuricurvum sp. PC08-66]|nr:MAG: CoA-binding protein [Sulfuricurvum sp. PC08-66]